MALKWNTMINKEFHAQALKEQSLGIEVAPHMQVSEVMGGLG